jgi:hypothetical protein
VQFDIKLAGGAAMQCTARELFRLGAGLDFFRLLSFFFSGVRATRAAACGARYDACRG